MTLSQSPLSYEDCTQVLQAALDDPAGARIRFEDRNAATHYRMRCHQARAIDRRLNAETYDKGHPMHNASAFDRLTIREPRKEGGNWWLYIEQTAVLPGKIESLSSGETIDVALPAPPQKLLAPPTEQELAEGLNDMKVAEEGILPSDPPKGGFRR